MAAVRDSRTTRARVYETLRRQVVTLELPPGAALSENELSATLGVSRTPVREALILLAEEGLVQVFPQVGSFVSRVDPRRVADAQFIREAVELAALADLPAHLDPDLVRELQDNVERQRRPGLDARAFFDLDELFHASLLQLSGHGNAWPVVQRAKAHLDRARQLGLEEAHVQESRVSEHEEVLRAVLDGRQEEAVDLLRTHLRAVLADVDRVREESPHLFHDGTLAPTRRSIAVWT